MCTQNGTMMSSSDNRQSQQTTQTNRSRKLPEERSENLKDLSKAIADEDVFDFLNNPLQKKRNCNTCV